MRNWAGNYTFEAARVHRPTSAEDARRVVAAAPKIRAIGTRHSFNGTGDSPGDLIDLSGINPDIVIDREHMTVTAGAATSYGTLASHLHREGFALHNLASLPHISIAGAVATATHGSGDGNESLASAVAAFDLVMSDGSLKHMRRGEADFAGMVVGLGAFGIVTRVTLDLQPTFDVRQDAFVDLPWNEMLEKFDAISSAAYSVSILTKWSGPNVNRIWLKTRVNASSSRQLNVAHIGLKPGLPHAVPKTTENPLALLTPFGGIAGPWSERLAHMPGDIEPSPPEQIQSEYFIARPRLAEAVAIIRSMADRIDPVLHGTEIRTVASDALWLSPAYKQDVVGLHFTWKSKVQAVDAATRDIEAALIPLGAKPHWGKVIHADAETLRPLYPRMLEFRACAARYDPNGKFRNAFLDKHVFGEKAPAVGTRSEPDSSSKRHRGTSI
jgi:alditol oxidase